MKVCLTCWAPFVGGAEVAAERLALGLTAAGHSVLLVVGTDGEALQRFRAAGLRCEFVPQRFTDKWQWLDYRRSLRSLLDILRREQPAVLHSNELPTHQMTGDAGRRLGIPRVCHHRWIFDGAAIDWFNKYGAERHVFVSRALMTDLRGKSAALAAAATEVVYDGLPLPKSPDAADRIRLRRTLSLDEQRLVVMFAGQIIERKGVADLIHAWAQLTPWHRAADLLIIGDDLEGKGAYRRAMEQLAADVGCPARFLGFQKNVADWLVASDVVLVPSHAEPLGNATLEAMAYARPVVGGNVGGIPEMIEDGRTGVLVPARSPQQLAQAIDHLLKHAEVRERMGQAARERCERYFSLDAHVRAMLVQYDAALTAAAAAR